MAAQHVWVRPEWTKATYPGLLLAWRRHPKRGWEALVVYAENDDAHRVEWRLSSEVVPAPNERPPSRF